MIRFEHLSEAQKRAYLIADNQLALQAGWSEELLAQELAWLREAGLLKDVCAVLDDDGFRIREQKSAVATATDLRGPKAAMILDAKPRSSGGELAARSR